MVTDPLAQMFVQIQNALSLKKREVSFFSSKEKVAILRVLKDLRLVEGYDEQTKDGKKIVKVKLFYAEGKSPFSQIKKLSKPSLRVYRKIKALPKDFAGLKYTIVSTPQGVMTATQARKKGLGGELICEVT